MLVTGTTGFIGANLVRKLIKSGYTVRAFVRPNSNKQNLNGLYIEIAYGDLTDASSLLPALEGCEGLFHLAASYTFWAPDSADIYKANVKGTENIMSAARKTGIKKIVYTSSEGTLKIVGKHTPGNEAELANPDDLPGGYKMSKCQAEILSLKMCQEGLLLVVVNPTTPIGAYDIKPTPTGKIIVDFLNRKMPACADAGLNVVDVEDVTKGHILAMKKGRVGERYILENKNLTLRQLFDIMERLTGIKAPRITIPLWTALAVAYVDEFVNGRILKKYPGIPVAAVKAARKYRHFDCSKAINELGLPQTPVEESLEKAIIWFTNNGYVK